MDRYFDRVDAGRRLGKLLVPRIDGPAVVLGVPRGGVQVGAQVAKALHAPLVPLLVRKVGLPEQPDVVVGAIDADGAMVTTDRTKDAGLLPAEMEGMGEDVARRLLGWRESFGSPDPASVIRGHVAVVVDDAVISGLTTSAGIEFLERRGAQRIVVAVPCGVSASLRKLEARGVEVIAPLEVERPDQIPGTYEHLPEVSAKEVAILLAQGGPSRPRGLSIFPGVDQPLRIIDPGLESHPARLRIPEGIGPSPAMILLGDVFAPGGLQGDALVLRLAEAGIASLRMGLTPGAQREAVLAAAFSALASRPELDPFRLGLLAMGQEAEGAVRYAAGDRRSRLLVVVDAREGLEIPERSLVVQAAGIEGATADRIARWVADRLYPTESA